MSDFNYVIRFAKQYLLPHWILGIQAWVCGLINLLIGLLIPLIGVYIIDHVILLGNISFLNVLFAMLLLLVPVQTLFEFVENMLLASYREKVLFEVQSDLFQHIQNLPLGFFQQNQGGYILSRVTNELDNLEGSLANGVLDLVNNLISLTIIICILFFLHWKLAIITLILLPMFISNYLFFGNKVQRKEKIILECGGLLSGFMQESIQGIRNIRAYQKERFIVLKYIKRARNLIRNIMDKEILISIASGMNQALSTLGPLIVLWYGGREIINNNLTLGQFIAINAYVGQLFGPVTAIMSTTLTMKGSISALQRIYELIDLEPDTYSAVNTVSLSRLKKEMVFQNISFGYEDDQMILDDINLRIPAGSKVAFVGFSGSGKTTIVNLVMKFYNPSRGKILFDEVDITSVHPKTLRSQIGFVDQENFLFHGTIKDNIVFGYRQVSDEQIYQASVQANAHSFITSFANGYDTIIGDRGQGLSSGQKQRIALARAFLRNPEILILDEATSSLDNCSEKLIYDAVLSLEGKTVIIVAHRLSSIKDVDIIYVLDRGKIMQKGTFEELISTEGLFKDLYQSSVY